MKSDKRISEWVKEINHDPSVALADLYRLYRDPFLVWSCREHNFREEAAKDAFQEALIAVYNNAISGRLVEGEAQMKTYLFTIAKNKLIEAYRKEDGKTYQSDFQSINGQELETFRSAERMQEYNELVQLAMKKISPECSRLIDLFYLQRYDMQSVARELGLKNANTAKSKKVDCMKHLIVELNKLMKNQIKP